MTDHGTPPEPLNPLRRESLDLRLRFQQLPGVVRRAARHPSWLMENLRLLNDRRAERRREFVLADHREHIVDERTAVTTVLGVSGGEYDAARDALWTPPRDPGAPSAIQDSRLSLQRLVSATVRLQRPSTMVETGVARGFTTAVALTAMEELDQGRLYSVDLPALEHEQRLTTGEVVPEHLHHRWELVLGPSRQVLRPLVERVAPIDLFLHDSDHTWASQIEEYRTVWPHLRPGGVIVADDIYNDAFLTFAREVAVAPYLIGRVESDNAIGILAKTATGSV